MIMRYTLTDTPFIDVARATAGRPYDNDGFIVNFF